MKNIFKFMGIALMACSLTFVSCSKDENEDTPNDPQNPQNPVNPEQPASYTLTVDGVNPNWGYVSAKAYDQDGQWGMGAFQAAVSMSNDNVQFPYFFTVFYAAKNNQTGENLMVLCDFLDNVQYATELYYEEALDDGQGNMMGDYQLEDITNYNFGTFDATKHTISCSYSLVMYEYMAWQTAIQEAITAAGYTVADWNNGVIPQEERQAMAAAADAAANHANVEFSLTNYPFVVAE